MSSIDALIAHARARTRTPGAALAPQPRLRAVIFTCMDARIDPVSLFGLGPGDAHVLRNAGARATPDVLRSLALSQAILGTREVLVLGHTGCGLSGRTERELAEEIRIKSGHKPGMELGCFENLDLAVGQTVEALRHCTFLAHRDAIHGYIYDLDDASVRPIEKGTPPAGPLTGLRALPADVLNLKTSRRNTI